MATNIDQLKGLVTKRRGFALPTMYKVILPSLGFGNPGELNLLCSNVSLPGRQIMTADREIGGVLQKVANNHGHTDVNMTFRVMNDYMAKTYFEAWQRMAIDQGEQGDEIGLRYASNYTHPVQIQQLKKGFGFPIYKTALPMPRLPPELQNRLPTIGPFDFAQGEFDLNLITADQIVYECTLEGAFPTSLNAISLSDAGNNTVVECSVQFSYRRWRNTKGSSAAGPLTSILQTVKDVVGL
jgi:hypothetical protein